MKVSVNDGAPVFDDAETVLVCRKLFAQRYDENSFVDKSLLDTYYGKESQHTFYIVEIEKILVK